MIHKIDVEPLNEEEKRVIVDIDDNYLAVRETSPAYKDYAPGAVGRGYLGALLELADGLIVSTEPLKTVYSELNKNIDVLPNCIELEEWARPNIKNDGVIRIGFSGGVEHKVDLEIILEPMAYILAKYPNVKFEVCAALDPLTAMQFGTRMNEFCKKDITKQFGITGGTDGATWLGYPQLLNSFGWNIIIAPLIDDEFNRGKSHIRWLESTMVGCPVIASPVYPYLNKIKGKDTIVHNKTGMFADTAEAWYNALVELIESESKRMELVGNAYKYISENWTYELNAKNWKKVINKYLCKRLQI